jgi:hypothetical protein
MSEFGYIPESPEQSFQNNKGIFTPKDIYDLTRADKYTNYGQLELIETQTITSSTSAIDFINLATNPYNVYFLTINGLTSLLDTRAVILQLSNDNGSTFITSGYQYAHQVCKANATFTEEKSTSAGHLVTFAGIGNATNEVSNGYCYLYNLLDSTKYSFATQHSSGLESASILEGRFGSGVLPTAEIHNAIRIRENVSTDFDNAVVSLYGIRYT